MGWRRLCVDFLSVTLASILACQNMLPAWCGLYLLPTGRQEQTAQQMTVLCNKLPKQCKTELVWVISSDETNVHQLALQLSAALACYMCAVLHCNGCVKQDACGSTCKAGSL